MVIRRMCGNPMILGHPVPTGRPRAKDDTTHPLRAAGIGGKQNRHSLVWRRRILGKWKEPKDTNIKACVL